MPFLAPIGFSLGVTGSVASGVGVGLASAVGAGAVGLGAYGASKFLSSMTPKQQPSYAGSTAQSRNTAAVDELQAAQNTASTQAAELVRRRRRSGTQTTFTNPLGISDQATVAKKTLLGE